MFKEMITRLMSFPRKSQIQVDFDLDKKNFHLSTTIFSVRDSLPKEIKDYVEARQNSNFKPHITSFHLEDNRVKLIQEIPFTSPEFQNTMRKHINEFLQMSRRCHRMFCEIALEEKYKDALHLDTHFEE